MTTVGDRSTSGNITANSPGPGNVVNLTDGELDRFAVQVTGTWTGTLTFEGSVDGTDYAAIAMTPVATGIGGAVVTTTTGNGEWQGAAFGFAAVQVRATASWTGTAVVTISAANE